MQDREILTDMLHTAKRAAADYHTCTTECAHLEVKSLFSELWKREQDTIHRLFCQMQTRGWYAVEEAEETKKADVKAQFAGCNSACACAGDPCPPCR